MAKKKDWTGYNVSTPETIKQAVLRSYPREEWEQAKANAHARGMSIAEYFRALTSLHEDMKERSDRSVAVLLEKYGLEPVQR